MNISSPTSLFQLAEFLDEVFLEEGNDDNFIKDGFDAQLDEYQSLSEGGKEKLAQILEREISCTGTNSLKIKYNKVLGYFFEVPLSQSSSLPDYFIRRQTLANAERFITPELKEFEEKILSAQHLKNERQNEIFQKVSDITKSFSFRVQNASEKISEIDLISSFSFTAQKRNFCRPRFCPNNNLEIINGRHPVVESFLQKQGKSFIPNNLSIQNDSFHLITGPNMAGKSTYLRQNALLLFLAHIGSFIPAQTATIPLVDQIFTRIGSGDSLSTGESTFLVEMQESSRILRHATQKSFVILDEIGRGTSTYDGLSIAWAITEFLHSKKIKTLFATHYHELIALCESLPLAKNFSVQVLEDDQKGVVFLHCVSEGGATKSFGVEVAKLAGVPNQIVKRAEQVLLKLEQTEKNPLERGSQISLFDKDTCFPQPKTLDKKGLIYEKKWKELQDSFVNLSPEKLTPLQAMQEIFKLRDLLEKKE